MNEYSRNCAWLCGIFCELLDVSCPDIVGYMALWARLGGGRVIWAGCLRPHPVELLAGSDFPLRTENMASWEATYAMKHSISG